jgi:beta-galactosidase/beta-glucuronidase
MRYIICILIIGWIGMTRCLADEPVFTLDDLFVATTMNSIDIELIIQNVSRHTRKCEVDIVIKEANGKTFLHLPRQTHLLQAGESRNLKFSKEKLEPELWSPEHPVLYLMHTTLIVGTKHVVSDERKIGFKSFEVRGHLFYLNGKPYYLRGLSQWPVSRIIDENGKKAPEVWEDEEFVKRFFQKAKALNINAGRIGDHDLWVKYADEMGFLNVAGSYSGAGAKEESVFTSNRNNFAPKIRKLRNHVSTAIYTLANEIVWERHPSFLSLAKDNYLFARSIDSTRPIIANAGFGKGKVGDIEDIHDYTVEHLIKIFRYSVRLFFQGYRA